MDFSFCVCVGLGEGEIPAARRVIPGVTTWESLPKVTPRLVETEGVKP